MALNEFLQRIASKDVARPNRFKVSFHPPAGLAADRNIDLVTESITMPGQNIRSVPDDLRFGPAREQAQGVTYGPFTATFICTTGLPEKVFFESWQDLVFNKGANEWQVKFYNDYYGSITISQLDKLDNPLYVMTVHEAYPKTINEQQYSLGSNDAHQTITVEFTYRWWEKKVEEPKETKVSEQTKRSITVGSTITPPKRHSTNAHVHRSGDGGGGDGITQPGTNPEHPGKAIN